MSVVDDTFKIVTTGLDFNKPIDRLQGAYVQREATRIHQLHGSWSAIKVASQLKEELAQIAAYVKSKDALIAGTEKTQPAHLDLRDSADIFSGMGSFTQPFVEAQEKLYRVNRAVWVPQIVWRAVAIHATLWESEMPPRLAIEALDEILDRRLRAVEQLHCNVNSGGMALGTSSPQRTWKVQGPNGPWIDGVIVRNFEYPNLPKDPFKHILSSMTNWVDMGSTLQFNPSDPNQAPVRMARNISVAWKALKNASSGNISLVFDPTSSLKHAEVFRRMFALPREDFFDRSWLYCDYVGSAINIEALEFGMQRHPDNHTNFESVMTKTGYVRLGAVVRALDHESNKDILMSDDNDEFFENTFIDFEDLQIGDNVCFWNNIIYDTLVASGDWRYENSHIMGLDVNPFTGKLENRGGLQLWLAGHGILTQSYNSMAAELIGQVKRLIDNLRSKLQAALATNAPIPTTRGGQILVSWTPYESFDPPGAWWIKIPKDIWNRRWGFKELNDVTKSVPRTVAKEVGGTGYNAPPDVEAVYFPLFEPQMGGRSDSWRAYLQQRKANPIFKAPTQLKPLAVDGQLAQGLYYQGAQTKIPVVRPKVRK